MTNHKAKAERLVATVIGHPSTGSMEMAQVHATLYLAEQQRIANLIAVSQYDETQNLIALRAQGLLEDPMDTPSDLLLERHDRVGRSFAEIKKALGL